MVILPANRMIALHAYALALGLIEHHNAGDISLLDEAVAARYPHSSAYLPVARLEDGTMTNW